MAGQDEHTVGFRLVLTIAFFYRAPFATCRSAPTGTTPGRTPGLRFARALENVLESLEPSLDQRYRKKPQPVRPV